MKRTDPEGTRAYNNAPQSIPALNTPGNYELRLVEGIHPRETAPTNISLKGTLAAPYDFLSKRQKLVDDAGEDILLQINKQSGTLDLTVYPTGTFTSHSVVGSLTRFADLDTFKINVEAFRWTVKSFIHHLRMFKFYFDKREQCESMITSLQTITGKIERVFKEHNDNTGNSTSLLETRLNSDDIIKDRKFKLNIPIYKGYRACKIDVELCLEPKSGTVEFYLMSDDLALQERTEKEAIFAEELKKFETYKFSKVVVG